MKVCVAGVGRMGARHVVAAKSAGFEVAGVFDPSVDAMKAVLKEQGLPDDVAFSSAEDMLASVKPDAFVVASTAPGHCDHVCKAAEAGVRYILCEKPMAVSLDECDRMIAACKRTGALLGVNHQLRYMEQYSKVRELVDSPEFGGLRSMTIASSNIGFSMNGSHFFETFRYISGQQIASVSAWLDDALLANPRGSQYQDRSGQMRGVSASGQRLYVELGGDLGHGIYFIYGCRHGQIFFDLLTGTLRLMRRQEKYRDLPTARYDMPADETTLLIGPANIITSTEALWRDMLAGRDFPDGRIGRYTVSGVIAANISGEQGGAPIRLDAIPGDRKFAWA